MVKELSIVSSSWTDDLFYTCKLVLMLFHATYLFYYLFYYLMSYCETSILMGRTELRFNESFHEYSYFVFIHERRDPSKCMEIKTSFFASTWDMLVEIKFIINFLYLEV